MINNVLDLSKENNQLFIACVLAFLCESNPVTVPLQELEKYWKGEVKRLGYDMVADSKGKSGTITFSMKENK